MILYYIWDAKSPMILSQFFARMTPLATRMPREPRDMALETSFLVTIPAPHSSSVLFFAFATASAEPLTVFGLCSETDLPVPIRSGGSTATKFGFNAAILPDSETFFAHTMLNRFSFESLFTASRICDIGNAMLAVIYYGTCYL